MSRSESAPIHGPGTPPETAHEPDPEPKLWVELGIDVGRSRDCPLGGGRAIGQGTVQLVGSTCHITVEDSETSGAGRRTVTTAIDDECLCPSLCEAGLSPVEMTVDGGSLVVGAYSPNRERLGDAIAQLEGTAERWRLRRLSSATRGNHLSESTSHPEELNLTEKQREAVQLAVDEGYYDRPRDVSLGELAERLDITRSALSQRLNAVESKLITDLSRHL